MLAATTSKALRSALNLRRVTSVRFNSNKPSSSFKTPFYDTYQTFLKSQKISNDGSYIKEFPTLKDFKESSLYLHVQESIKEKDNLIQKKLEELANKHNVSIDEINTNFNSKFNALLNNKTSENAQINAKINSFIEKIQLPVNDESNLMTLLVQNLLKFGNDINTSSAFKFVYNIDSSFATSLGKLLKVENPSTELIDEVFNKFNNGPLSEISNEQFEKLKDLLESGAISKEVQTEFTPELIIETVFSNLNNFQTVEKAPLFELIKSIDSKFAELLKEYESTDSNDDLALEEKFNNILATVKSESSAIYKSFNDATTYSQISKILSQPVPINLDQIYEIFEQYDDYFVSSLFKAIEEIDPKFANLLKDLEALPEGEQLDSKNLEIDEYLNNSASLINISMNDIKSDLFSKLNAAINEEAEKLKGILTTDKLLEFVINNPENKEFNQLLNKIDPVFTQLTEKLNTIESDEQSVEVFNELDGYLHSENCEILHILNDKENLNYKLLNDLITKELENPESSVTSETEAVAETTASQVTEGDLAPEVVEVNEKYDMAISVLEELQNELKDNTFIPVSRKVSEKMDQLLGFQPSKEQVESITSIKHDSLPVQKDEVLELIVNIIMKDGKKEIARNLLNKTLYLIFLETRSNPVEKFKQALDIVAPIVVTKTVKTGYAKNFTVPVPLTQRQRNRMALLWILKSSDSKASNDFSVRLCDEILHILNGKSALMDKRVLAHKLAIANRSYLTI